MTAAPLARTPQPRSVGDTGAAGATPAVSVIIATYNSGSLLMRGLLGGWQVSTITTIQSGTSINPESWDAAGMGAGFPHANRLHCRLTR